MTRFKQFQLPITSDAWACLSALRFFLASIVLLGHLNQFNPESPLVKLAFSLDGKSAVIGFLLVSGFSIAHSITVSPQHYYRRRFLRIYPLYFTAIALTIALTLLIGSPFQIPNRTYVASGWPTMLGNFGFLQGFFCVSIPYNGPVWTLSIEVALYIIAPLLLLLNRGTLLCFALVSLTAFALLNGLNTPWGMIKLWNGGSLLYGCSLLTLAWPWLLGFGLRRFGLGSLELLFVFIGILVVAHSDFCSGHLAWITYFISVATMLWGGLARCHPFIKNTLNYLGDISYPLYLFHIPTLLFVYWMLHWHNVVGLGLMAIGSAVAMEYIVDQWFKNRFVKPLLEKRLQRNDRQ